MLEKYCFEFGQIWLFKRIHEQEAKLHATHFIMLWFKGLWLSEDKTDMNHVRHIHEEENTRKD